MTKRFSEMKMERPMDRMRVGISSPFEDEFAIANLSGAWAGLGLPLSSLCVWIRLGSAQLS